MAKKHSGLLNAYSVGKAAMVLKTGRRLWACVVPLREVFPDCLCTLLLTLPLSPESVTVLSALAGEQPELSQHSDPVLSPRTH